MKLSFWIIIFLFVVLPIRVHGQQFNFRNYSVGEGLAQSQVYAMTEDVVGNIWMGTRGGGLSRFDGVNFYNYTVKEGLPSNFIRALIKDRKGNLWIGTDEGLSMYDGIKFKNYSSAQGLYNTVVNCIMEDSKGKIWMGTDKGIFQLDKDTIYRFGRKLNAPMTPVNCLYQDNKGNVWAGTEFGLYFFNLADQPWSSKIYTNKQGLSGNIITSIVQVSENDFWISTYGGGVSRFYNQSFINYGLKDGLGSNTVYTLVRDQEGIWFGTANGLTEASDLKAEHSRFTNYTDTEGLPNNVITSLLKDSFGNLWLGTSGGGVSKLDGKRFTHYTEIKGVFGAWVYSILEDRNKNMWFGTSEGGVTRYDQKFYTRYSQKNNFTASKVKAIHEDTAGNLWFGTISDGAYFYNGKTFRHFNKQNGLSSNFINYILTDSSGQLWMATAGGGISIVKEAEGKFSIRKLTEKEGLSSNRVNSLLIDSRKNIWAATTSGVSYIIPGNDSVAPVIKNYFIGSGRGDNQVRSLAMNQRGIIFMGTADAGVVFFNGKEIIPLVGDDQLASRNIYSMIFDNENNLWVGTEKGFDKITFDKSGSLLNIKHFGKEEGFIGIEAMQNSVFKDSQGNLWLGSIKCATKYNPVYDFPVEVPRIHVTGIQLFFDPISKTEFAKDLKPWYPIPNQLKLPYDKNHLSFQFIGIEHRNPNGVKYKWKLEGFDEEWSPVSTRREAVYSNLPPGEYTFKVMAANESGVWNKKTETYSFVIAPPFWRTWWFRILAVVLLVGIIWLLISWRYKRLRKENQQERERLAMERNLLELEQKALRLQMNPHFLFNSLNSIKGLISENKPDEAKIYLSKFSKLMRTMLENSRETFIPLSEEINSLIYYLELEKMSLGEKLNYEINTHYQFNAEEVLIPPMLLQPFVENSIVHGLSPKSGNGMISITMEDEGGVLKCVVEDNGVGRNAQKSSKSPGHKSSALAITQERLNIINKKLNLGELKIFLEDVLDDNGSINGTRVILKIPYIKEK